MVFQTYFVIRREAAGPQRCVFHHRKGRPGQPPTTCSPKFRSADSTGGTQIAAGPGTVACNQSVCQKPTANKQACPTHRSSELAPAASANVLGSPSPCTILRTKCAHVQQMSSTYLTCVPPYPTATPPAGLMKPGPSPARKRQTRRDRPPPASRRPSRGGAASAAGTCALRPRASR